MVLAGKMNLRIGNNTGNVKEMEELIVRAPSVLLFLTPTANEAIEGVKCNEKHWDRDD